MFVLEKPVNNSRLENEKYGPAVLPSLHVSVGVTAGTGDYLSIQKHCKYIADNIKITRINEPQNVCGHFYIAPLQPLNIFQGLAFRLDLKDYEEISILRAVSVMSCIFSPR